MSTLRSSDDYMLGRDVFESIRLDAQHLLWKLHLGSLLHPSIKVVDNMRIADVGTGTAIWLLDLAQDLPHNVQLDGYDISDNQFPPQHLWPENVTLGLLDSLNDLPSRLVERYDVVHLRMWAINLGAKDAGVLIRNAKGMLKPGGYLQWEEPDFVHQVIKTSAAEDFERQINSLYKNVGMDYSWVHDLPESLEQEQLTVVHLRRGPFKNGLAQVCTNTNLLALKEILRGIRRMSDEMNSTLVRQCEDDLARLMKQNNSGLVYNWGPVSILGQKSVV